MRALCTGLGGKGVPDKRVSFWVRFLLLFGARGWMTLKMHQIDSKIIEGRSWKH